MEYLVWISADVLTHLSVSCCQPSHGRNCWIVPAFCQRLQFSKSPSHGIQLYVCSALATTFLSPYHHHHKMRQNSNLCLTLKTYQLCSLIKDFYNWVMFSVGRRKPGNAQWKKKLEIRGKDGRKWRLWLRIKWDGEASSRPCAALRSKRIGWW